MSSSIPPSATEQAPLSHLVQFYEDEEALISSAVFFLSGALAADGCAIVLGTKAHRDLMGTRIAEQFPEPRILLLDAAEALSRIRGDRGVDESLFRQVIGNLLDSVGPGPIRIYGELVALLAADGMHEEAVTLEQYWNDLAAQRQFKLFCGYPLKTFPGAQHSDAFRRVCHAHSDVLPAGGVYVSPMALAVLQQKALALDLEAARRHDAEKRLGDHQLEFSEFMENGAESLHQVAFDGTILWANRAELELLDYDFDEYVGRNISEFHADPPVLISI